LGATHKTWFNGFFWVKLRLTVFVLGEIEEIFLSVSLEEERWPEILSVKNY